MNAAANPMVDRIAEPSRTFLRVQTRIPATVFLNGKPYKRVVISDLSSTGLSFIDSKDSDLPSAFELRFRLKPFSKTITLNVESQNKADIQNGIRVGCVFQQVLKKDEERINNYLDALLNFSLADNVIFAAIFLCIIDISWRTIVYLMNGSYVGTGFGRDAGICAPSVFYKAALVYYALTIFIAALIITNMVKVAARIRFPAGLTLLAISFPYLAWKSVAYVQHRLWNAEYLPVRVLFWWDVFLLCYIAASIVVSFVLFKKVNFVFTALQKHNKGK